MVDKNVKGRPALITKRDVIECALTLGLANISMNRLGKTLGVSATALYRHIDSKEQLIVACCEHVLAEVTVPDAQDWEAYLYSFARTFRQVLLSKPGSVDFVRHNQQFTPASMKLANDALGHFVNTNIDVQTGFMAFATVFTKVTDIVQHQEQSQLAENQQTDLSMHSESIKDLPHLSKMFEQVKPVNYDDYFEDGLKISIEGIKAVYC